MTEKHGCKIDKHYSNYGNVEWEGGRQQKIPKTKPRPPLPLAKKMLFLCIKCVYFMNECVCIVATVGLLCVVQWISMEWSDRKSIFSSPFSLGERKQWWLGCVNTQNA